MIEENNLELSMAVSPKEQEIMPLEEVEYYEENDQLFSEEDLSQLLAIQADAKSNLATREGYQNYSVINVVHYKEDVELVAVDTGDVEYFDLCVVIAKDLDTEEITRIYYLDNREADIVELNSKYKSSEPIIKLINDTEKKIKLSPDDKELMKVELVDLEERHRTVGKENSEEENMPSIKEFYEPEKSPKDKEESQKISNLRGEVNLDQQAKGETLRKILGLGEEYKSIAPVKASSVGVKGSSKYCFVAIKNDKTCTVLGEDVLEEDRQEGINPYDKDTQVNRDGSISKESSIAGFKIANRPNFRLEVRLDENSGTRKTTIKYVSGRNSRTEEIGYELEKHGDGWQDSDARNSLRIENGIGESDEAFKKQVAYDKSGIKNDRIENIDEYANNDIQYINPDDIIEGTEITWKQFSNMCGYNGDDAIEKAYKEFIEHKKADPARSNREIVDQVLKEKETENIKENEDEGRVPWDSSRRRM